MFQVQEGTTNLSITAKEIIYFHNLKTTYPQDLEVLKEDHLTMLPKMCQALATIIATYQTLID
jgi:hypothetical protein